MKIETYRTILDNSYKNVIDYRTLTDSSNTTLNKLDEDTLFTIFNTKVATYENVNFDYGDILTTSLTIDISKNVAQVLPNYMKCTPQNDELDIRGQRNPMYYFITNVMQLNRYTWRFDLELDVMTTYFKYITFNSKVTFNRRHCERFGYATKDERYFTYNRDCLLDNTSIEPNILNVSNITYDYESLSGDNLTLVKTISECKWLYIFLSNNTKLISGDDSIGQYFFQFNGTEWKNYPTIEHKTNVKLTSSPISSIDGSLPFMTLVFPVYTSLSANDTATSVLTSGIEDVMSNSALTPYILSAKLSNRCPFSQSIITNNFSTSRDSRNHYLLKDSSRIVFTDKVTRPIVVRGERDHTLGFFIGYEWIANHKISLKPQVYEFDSLPSVEDKRNIYLEPQFYTSKYCRQGIKPYNKELMIIEPYYAIQSVKPSTTKITIYENNYTFLNYDVTTFRYPYQNSGVIQEGKTYVNNSDWCVVNDNYQQAMASSKNSLYMGLESQLVSNATSSILGGMNIGSETKSITKDVDKYGAISFNSKATTTNSNLGGKAISSLISFGVNTMTSINNFNAKLKDLENTPNSIKIQGMDILNELSYFNKGIGHYIYYNLDDTQKEVVYNYYYDYGYQVNKPYSLSSQVEYGTNIITRKLFNYIKISDEDFIFKSVYLAKLPNIVKDKIYDIFTNGFKLWEYIDCNTSFIKDYLFSNENENIEIYDIKGVSI